MSDAHIGIVGGVGPLAGVDLARKIMSNTVASTDQDHIPLTLISIPSSIEDRTRFLLGESIINPAHAVVSIVGQLAAAGATVIGIPCNTMHAPPIFDVILRETRSSHPGIQIVSMVEEVVRTLCDRFGPASAVGILTTAGGYRTALYSSAFSGAGLRPIVPDEQGRSRVHEAIYSPEYGIKAHPDRVSNRALEVIADAVQELRDLGAEAVIAGCTELAYAITEPTLYGVPIVSSTDVLARALVARAAPEKLRRVNGRR